MAHPGPPPEVHHGVSRLARARRNRCRSAAVPFAESERSRRKVCFVDQERVAWSGRSFSVSHRCAVPSLSSSIIITESATIKGSGTRCSKRKNASAVLTGRCDVVSVWAACSAITTVPPHRSSGAPAGRNEWFRKRKKYLELAQRRGPGHLLVLLHSPLTTRSTRVEAEGYIRELLESAPSLDLDPFETVCAVYCW